jgi:multimeric flavodoxin WrbA
MKVIGFVGSPRKNGNTQLLVEKVLAGSAAEGAETKIFYLNDLNIKSCQACNFCKTHDHCQQDDDMTQLYEELITADGVVIGSPIYMGYLSAQTKLFFDRLYAFFNPGAVSRLPRGKKGALVFAQGGGDDIAVLNALAQRLSDMFGIEIKGIVGGNGMNELGIVKNNAELMNKAFGVGKELTK